MQAAILNDTNAWYWMNVPYLMQQLQGRYRQSEVESIKCQCALLWVLCLLTQTCLWP